MSNVVDVDAWVVVGKVVVVVGCVVDVVVDVVVAVGCDVTLATVSPLDEPPHAVKAIARPRATDKTGDL